MSGKARQGVCETLRDSVQKVDQAKGLNCESQSGPAAKGSGRLRRLVTLLRRGPAGTACRAGRSAPCDLLPAPPEPRAVVGRAVHGQYHRRVPQRVSLPFRGDHFPRPLGLLGGPAKIAEHQVGARQPDNPACQRGFRHPARLVGFQRPNTVPQHGPRVALARLQPSHDTVRFGQ